MRWICPALGLPNFYPRISARRREQERFPIQMGSRPRRSSDLKLVKLMRANSKRYLVTLLLVTDRGKDDESPHRLLKVMAPEEALMAERVLLFDIWKRWRWSVVYLRLVTFDLRLYYVSMEYMGCMYNTIRPKCSPECRDNRSLDHS